MISAFKFRMCIDLFDMYIVQLIKLNFDCTLFISKSVSFQLQFLPCPFPFVTYGRKYRKYRSQICHIDKCVGVLICKSVIPKIASAVLAICLINVSSVLNEILGLFQIECIVWNCGEWGVVYVCVFILFFLDYKGCSVLVSQLICGFVEEVYLRLEGKQGLNFREPVNL